MRLACEGRTARSHPRTPARGAALRWLDPDAGRRRRTHPRV